MLEIVKKIWAEKDKDIERNINKHIEEHGGHKELLLNIIQNIKEKEE